MKNLFLSVTLALGWLSTNVLNAAIQSQILMVDQQEKQFALHVDEDPSADFSIRFVDLNGRVLHKETELNQYSKRFDVKNLAPGEYKLELEDNSQIVYFNITVLEDIIDIEKNATFLILKPNVQVNEKGISLNMKTLKNPTQVQIFDDRGEMIYSKTYTEVERIGAYYDLKRRGNGDYRIIVKTKAHTFTEDLVIE